MPRHVRTASSGYAPRAVYPRAYRVGAGPDRFATSVASAPVGRAEEIIDSSIWVAVTTGFGRRLFAARDQVFLDERTSSSGISIRGRRVRP